MWLTRSRRPFCFTNEYDSRLPFTDCADLGLYVHIPFCRSLCNFCPYCKQLYDSELCRQYVDALLHEIDLVGRQRPGAERQKVTSLYFGGGTPALVAGRLAEIVQALARHFVISEGIGLELHPEDVRPEIIARLQNAGVSKLSIGVQSFQPRLLKLLGRQPPEVAGWGAALRQASFATVSMDFIFALPGQTLADLQADIEQAQALGANHIAVYPFIDFAFTPTRVQPLRKQEKRRLLDALTDYCLSRGWRRTSIWTFARPSAVGRGGYSSMTRGNYLGFGCSAVTLLREQFKINTFSVPEYCRRLANDKLPTSLTLRFTPRQRMLYYLFWVAYGMEFRAADFARFFGVPLPEMYGAELKLAQMLGWLTEQDGIYRLTKKGTFYYHYYENFYTLAYIDKMWGLMRHEPWPERLEL